jgi:hypothetical protein
MVVNSRHLFTHPRHVFFCPSLPGAVGVRRQGGGGRVQSESVESVESSHLELLADDDDD